MAKPGHNGMKQTEIGLIPEAWDVRSVADCFEIQQGKALNKKAREGKSPYPFLRTANVYWGCVDLSEVDEMDFSEAEVEKLCLRPGDLLVCEGGDIGRTAIWEGQLDCCMYQNHLHRLRPSHDGVEPRFFMYWMQTALTQLGLYTGEGIKTTIPNLSKGRLGGFMFPLPPLLEQRAIAHVLRTVQQAKEATEKVIAATRQLKQSLMRHLFTYGPVPFDQADQVKLKETEIEPVPQHWNNKTLGEIVTLQRGHDLPLSKRNDGPYPVIGSNGVVGYHSEFTAKGPGVFVGRSGSVGKVSYIDSAYWPLNTTLWAKDFHGNDERYIYYFLSRIDFSKYTGGVSVPTLNRNLIHPIKSAIPTIGEQRQIAQQLTALETKIDVEERRRNSLEAIFNSLLHHLMTGKLRVHDLKFPV